jgi:YcxB-like protein
LNGDSQWNGARSVTVQLTRWDLLWLNVGVMARWRGAWVAVVSAIIGAVVLQARAQNMTGAGRGWLVLASAVLLTAAVASIAGCLVALGVMLFSSGEASLLGQHTYTFHDDGLRERTDASDTLIRWGGVRAVLRRGSFILIHVAPGLSHALPRRSFGTPSEYQAFWRAAQLLAGRQSEQRVLAGQQPS